MRFRCGFPRKTALQSASNTSQLPVFAPDTREKLDQMIRGLIQADYIVVSSNRTHGVIRQLPARYPMTGEYYRHLFEGTLGFSPVRTFTHFPRLFGWEIDDSAAEEQFIVFDTHGPFIREDRWL